MLLQLADALPSTGVKKLPAAARADVVRRMRRCGLAASLDHALRLLFSAQDAGLQVGLVPSPP